jgi:hypothetical protein
LGNSLVPLDVTADKPDNMEPSRVLFIEIMKGFRVFWASAPGVDNSMALCLKNVSRKAKTWNPELVSGGERESAKALTDPSVCASDEIYF